MNQDLAARLQGTPHHDVYVETVRTLETDGWLLHIAPRLYGLYESARERKDAASTWEQNRVAHGEVQTYLSLLELPEAMELEFESIADSLESEEEHE